MPVKERLLDRATFTATNIPRLRYNNLMERISGIFSVALFLSVLPAVGQEIGGVRGPWKFEEVLLKQEAGGKLYQGLLLEETAEGVEMLEVVRPAGKPMYLVTHPLLRRDSIAKIERLEAAEKQALAQRIADFRAAARIELGRMEDVTLTAGELAGNPAHLYASRWFRVASTANEETTRRAIVRIEQIFRAYRQILPPQIDQKEERPLLIQLFGSMDAYREHLRRQGVALASPAYYSPAGNRIAAGSDLDLYAARVEQIRAQSNAFRQQYEAKNKEFPALLASISAEMRKAGYARREIEEELAARKGAWQTEYEGLLNRLDEVERRNTARFADVTGEMFARLYHEAFHAYLENFVLPSQRYEMPRWLNEGLAQIFEQARFDGDMLRVDAPHGELMTQLQQDLAGPAPLELARLLTAADDAFLREHGRPDRLYAYSWGVAHDLVFQRQLLQIDRLQAIAAPGEADPIRRFERFLGQPLPEYQSRWRKTILEGL